MQPELATAASSTFVPAGEHRADQVPVGAHLLYGARDVGRVVRIDEMVAVLPGMVAAVRDDFTNDIVGQPVLKFELYVHGFDADHTYYFARLPHEPVTIVEV